MIKEARVYNKDGISRDPLIILTDVTIEDKANPKAPRLDAEIQKRKDAKKKARLTIREDLEKELKSKTGFLDELMTLVSILTSNSIAMFVWAAFFTFFLTIELFVLTNKFGDHDDDYDEVVMHQMKLHKLRLSKLDETR